MQTVTITQDVEVLEGRVVKAGSTGRFVGRGYVEGTAFVRLDVGFPGCPLFMFYFRAGQWELTPTKAAKMDGALLLKADRSKPEKVRGIRI